MKHFTLNKEQLKFMRWLLLMPMMLGIALQAASAQAAPSQMSISCNAPYPGKQNNLKRPKGDSDIWTFSIVLTGGARFVDGPHWSYPGGSDPDWGTWSGGQDGSSSLSWAAPQKTGGFSIRVNGKIVCGDGGGGGEPIPFEAGWDGEVVAKEWKAEPAIEGGILVKPQDQTASPATPAIVLVKTSSEVDCEVTEATDKDTWTEGDDEGDDDDTIKYKWTASGGGFVTDEHPTGDAPFAETRTAKWKTPEEPGDYTLECTIDDLPKELEENETGSRDDEPVKRTLQVKVVKMKFVPAVIRLYKDDTRDVDVLIAPEDVSSLFTFAMLDSGVATHSGAPVTFTITGVAAGNTKFQVKYNDKVFGEATVIVKEHVDEETDDLDDDGILDIFDDDIDGDGIIDNIPAKLWSPDTGISGGTFAVSEVTVAAGGTVGLEVTQASDSDKWRTANDSDYESDTVHYDWSATGGSITPDGSEPWKSTFTAPNQSGEYYVKVKIDDEPAAVTLPDRGNRDDSSVTRTIKIIVTQKEWDVDLAIGKYRQEDGTVKENGRMVLPQDQTGDDPVPEHVKVAAGATIDLLVEEATDVDHWKIEPDVDEGYDNDTVTYLWESQSGQIVGDANKRSAKWQAPTQAGTYTITCTIDDTPKEIAAGEDGERDDTSVKRTVEVEVVNGESSATLKLYKDEELTEEVDGAVGGTAYIVLEVKLGEGQHLVSNSATLRVEENYAQHSDTEKRWDSAVSFASGWQKKDANGEWQDSVSSPQSTNNSDDDEYYRKVWPWSTTSTPLGHNENHSIKLVKVDGSEETELKFAGAVGEGETKGPSGISAEVKNLVITDISTNSGKPDYFKFDPDSDDTTYKTPELSFTIEDSGDPHQYKWTVKIRSTSVEDQEWIVFCRGQVPSAQKVSFKINDPEAPNTQEGQLIYRGTYTFDISVEEYDDLSKEDPQYLDGQTLRSTYLSVPPKYDENKPGHDFYNEWVGSELHAKLDYYLKDTENKDASKAHVDFLNPEWEVKASSDLSTAVNTPHLNIDLYTYSSDVLSGYYKALLTAEDDHGAKYRDHENKWMPAVNGFERNLTIEWINGEEDPAYPQILTNPVDIIWIKKSQLGWSSKRKVQVAELKPEVYAANPNDSDVALPTVKEHVWSSLLNASGFNSGYGSTIGSPSIPAGSYNRTIHIKNGTIWSASNGTYYKTENPPKFPLSGDIGINGVWSNYDETRSVGADYRRWSFGVNGSGFKVDRSSSFPYVVQTPDGNDDRWFSSSAIKGYNYGLGGVGCLIQNGKEVPENQIFPLENGAISDNLSKSYGRIILAWTRDGKNAFIVRLHGTFSGYLGSTGWTGVQAQNIIKDYLPRMIANYTKSKHNSNGLQIKIDGAILLDGGTHGQIVYAWSDRTIKGVYNGSREGAIDWLYDHFYSKKDPPADTFGGRYSEGRGTRSAIEAFDLP